MSVPKIVLGTVRFMLDHIEMQLYKEKDEDTFIELRNLRDRVSHILGQHGEDY